MGELILIQQPRRVSEMGILGSSKGTSYATGVAPAADPPIRAPTPTTAVSMGPAVGANQILRALDSISNPEPPQRMTATGDPLPSYTDKARGLPARFTPEPPYVPPPQVTPRQVPADAGGGGGGGGGAAGSTDDAGGAAADAPVFLGLTQKQLVIGGAVALGAFLLLRKKKHGAGDGGGLI